MCKDRGQHKFFRRHTISTETITDYFVNLAKELEDIPRLQDRNPGQDRTVFRRGVKYPTRSMNSSKLNTSESEREDRVKNNSEQEDDVADAHDDAQLGIEIVPIRKYLR